MALTLHLIFCSLSISPVHESYKTAISLPPPFLLGPRPHYFNTSNRSKSSKSPQKEILIHLESG